MKKMNLAHTKKTFKSFVNTKQRITALFTATVLLLQIVLPAAAAAATLISNESVSAAMQQPQFQLSKNANYLYEQAAFDDSQYLASPNIASFHASLRAAKINVGKPQYIPIAGDITVFVPTYPVGKLLGDNYVQARYIRQQIINSLGRHLIDSATDLGDENKQIKRLYDNAFTFAQNYQATYVYGNNLPAALAIPQDMIWPELRTINGVQVMVPVLYLTTASINTFAVNEHVVEFKGNTASFKTVSLDHVALVTGVDTVIRVQSIVLTGGNFSVIGDLNLVVGGTLELIGSTITATKNISILAAQFIAKALVQPFTDRYGSGTRLGRISNVDSATGNISITTTAGDIQFEGSTATASNGSITLNSSNNISILPVTLDYSGNSSTNAWRISNSSVDVVGSKLSAKDTISLYAAGAITISASELISTQGGIELLAQQGIYVLDEQGNTQVNRQKIKGRTKGTSSDFNTWAVRSVLNAGKGVLMDTADGDITLRAAQISSTEGTGVYARNGKVHLLITKEQSQHYLNMVRKGTWTIKTHTVEQNNETPVPNSIVGGFAVEALQGVDVEYTGLIGANGKPIEDLDVQMDAYKNMPELAWMADLRNNPNVNAAWNQVKLIKINKDKTNRQLSPAAMAIVAIAVAVASGGASIGSQGFLSSAMNAGLITLETQALSSVLAGNSPEQTLKNMASDESLKSLAISMVTAGAMNSLSNVNMELFSGDSMIASLGNQAVQAVVDSTVSAGVSVAINGGNSDEFKKAFRQSLQTNALNSITKTLAQKIGAAAHLPEDQRISVGTQYIAHAALGCLRGTLTAKINGSDTESACYSGSGGAVIGEAVGKYYASKLDGSVTSWAKDQLSRTGASPTDEELFNQFELFKSQGADIAQLSAAFAAFAAGGDVDVAASAGMNAAQNNALNVSAKLEQYRADVEEWWKNCWFTAKSNNVVSRLGDDATKWAMMQYVELNRLHDSGELSEDKYALYLAKAEYDLESAQIIPTTNGEFVLLGVEVAGQLTALKVSLKTKNSSNSIEVVSGEIIDVVPGRVKSRINVANGTTETTPTRTTGEKVSAGFDHVLDGHFDRPIANSRSIFKITPEELKVILQSERVVNAPVTAVGNGIFMRVVDTGKAVGLTSIKEGGVSTSSIKVFTDSAGNLISTYPIK